MSVPMSRASPLTFQVIIMRYKITTRTLGAASDPFQWVSDDFFTQGTTVDEAIEKGRTSARRKHPKGTIHLVYGAVPAPEDARSVQRPVRVSKKQVVGKGKVT
jgi:hypothetical protein